jgi:hypothetical protein
MVDNHSLRTHSWKLPDPEPDPEEVAEAAQDAMVDAVLNVYKERQGYGIALRVSFRLPPDKP